MPSRHRQRPQLQHADQRQPYRLPGQPRRSIASPPPRMICHSSLKLAAEV
jgi:hypothetical protein